MREIGGLLALAAGLLVSGPANAQGLNAYELLLEVEQCSLTLGGEAPKFDPAADALILNVGKSDIGKGITAHLFYFAPGRAGARDDFGLILDATPEAVVKALPHYAQPLSANGYRRELAPIGDPDGSGGGAGKSLLVCRAERT